VKEEFIPILPELLSAEQEQGVKKLSLLYEISQAMITTIKLNDLLEVIMTAVTMGGGLGFNRAMLFLMNREKETLQGMIGVGPDSADDACRIWNEFSDKKFGLLQWVLSPERKACQTQSRFDELCKGITVPLSPEGGILAKTILEKRSFNINDLRADEFIWARIFSKIGGSPFATVPIIAKRQATGVIMVDNSYSQKPITEEDLKMLTVFTSHAGMAIENSRLYHEMELTLNELKKTQERLLHHEKLLALGEMAASIAHEIKTPLVSIGGFARRLSRSKEPIYEKKYSEIIINEVDRLETTLNEILNFSKEPQFNFIYHDLNHIIEESLAVFSEEFQEDHIDVIRKLTPGLPPVLCDHHQIKQVFINLFANAHQAIIKEGALSVTSLIAPEDDVVAVEVKDTGGGIAPEIIENIFNPFFTTKDKGIGLGLAMAHKIIMHHRGTIAIRNNPGKGTTFILKFPAKGTD
jgi:hypothetical protein